MTHKPIHQGMIGCLALFVCWSGCTPSGQPLATSPPMRRVWPEPPAEPRIRYLGSIDTEQSIKRSRSLLEGLGEVVFGKRDMGVLVAPSALAMSPEGGLYVADSGGGVIHLFDYRNRCYRQFGQMGQDQSLQRPVGLTLVGASLYVVDSALHRVCVFGLTGEFVIAFGESYLTRPSGIAYHPDRQELYVSDTGAHRIVVFHPSGRYLRTMGSRGTGPGQFNFPTHLWVDSGGRLLISDTLNYRIQIVSLEEGTFTTWGEHGDRPGYFGHPGGVATDRNGHVYVTDRQFENVQIFDRYGRILMAFGKEGHDPGDFWLPSGLTIDERNWIYVADTFNKRIQVFEIVENLNHDN